MSAVDSDREAVAATLQNARANGVELDGVERTDLRHDHPPAADVVAANLMRPLLLRLARTMEGAPRSLIVSGLLEEEADELRDAFERRGLRERRRLEERGWAALLLGR